MKDMPRKRPRGDEGWFGIWGIILAPAAVIGVFVGIICIYVAVKI